MHEQAYSNNLKDQFANKKLVEVKQTSRSTTPISR